MEITVGVLAGGSALTGIATALIKFSLWILKRLIREEITPLLEDLTKEFSKMRSSFDLAQQAQEHSTESLHAQITTLASEIKAVNERVDFVESSVEGVSVRVEALEES
jgi:hemoglobin-like flavoprotein